MKKSKLDLTIELLEDERKPVLYQLAVIDAALAKLRQQRDLNMKPQKGPRPVSEKAS